MSSHRTHPLAGSRAWLRRRLPAGLLWHPFEWFCTFMCALSGALTLATPVESASVAALLPEVPYRIWGGFLVVGAIALASGLSSIRRTRDGSHYVVTRVPAYRLGLRILGLSVAIFVAALFAYAGADGIPASAIPIAFVGACLLRLLGLDDR